MTNLTKRAGIAGLVLLFLAAPVAAQSIVIGPNGARVEDPRDQRMDRYDDRQDRRHPRPVAQEISEREAVGIARREGLRDVDGVRRTRSNFRVDGSDRRGREMTVVVDRRTGDVISVR